MNIVVVSLLCWLLILVFAGILYIFKKFCLDKIKSGVLKYLLGMLLAYGLLFGIYVVSYYKEAVSDMLLNGRLFILYGPGQGAFGIFVIVIPAIYSIFLIGKGYNGEGGKNAPIAMKVKMSVSAFFNGIIAFFSLVLFNLFLNGVSVAELVEMVKDGIGANFIYLVFYIGAIPVSLYFIFWIDNKYNSRKNKSRQAKVMKSTGFNEIPSKTIEMGDVQIILGVSTPDVFKRSPYYVEFDSCLAVKGFDACICLVRERSDPEHVVGEIGFADDEDNEMPKPESVLKNSVIIEAIVLNERVGLV